RQSQSDAGSVGVANVKASATLSGANVGSLITPRGSPATSARVPSMEPTRSTDQPRSFSTVASNDASDEIAQPSTSRPGAAYITLTAPLSGSSRHRRRNSLPPQ